MDLLNEIIEKTEHIEFVGSGQSAIVYKLIFKNNVIRVLRYKLVFRSIDQTNKINIINKYRKQTTLFVKIYAAIIIQGKNLPKQFVPKYIESYELQKKLANIDTMLVEIEIMEDAGLSLDIINTDNWTKLDFKCLLFQYLYGILMARLISNGFVHGDVHHRNLTITTDPKLPKVYRLNDMEFSLNSPYVLHLIDYDTIETNISTETSDITKGLNFIKMETNELISFLGYSDKDKWVQLRKIAENSKETNALETILLKHPYFDELRVREERKKQKCINCSVQAKYRTKELEPKYFCSYVCNSQYYNV